MSAVTLVGIGNILLQDEGFGVSAIEALQREYRFSDGVQLLDGGTLGMELLGFISGSKKLMVIGAIDAAGPPGTCFCFSGPEVQAYFQEKLSMHELGIQDVLASLKIIGEPVEEVVVIGAKPFVVGAGVGLTPAMADLLEPIKKMAIGQLREWGVSAELLAGENR